jgi:hypothetical protein
MADDLDHVKSGAAVAGSLRRVGRRATTKIDSKAAVKGRSRGAPGSSHNPAAGGKCTQNRFRHKVSPELKRKALDALHKHEGNRRLAAKTAGVNLTTLDDWRRKDSEFAADWDAILADVMRKLRAQPRDERGRCKRSPLPHGGMGTAENKEIALAYLAAGATHAVAAAAIGVHRFTMRNWCKSDPGYAERFKEAVEAGIDLLEEEAIRRARDGVLRPVFYKGKVIGHVREYSDQLLMLLLIGKRPNVYGRRSAKAALLEAGHGIVEVRWKE